MNSVDQDAAAGLWDECDPPCLSLFQPTHRAHPDNQQDPIRFKNLVNELEKTRQQKSASDEIKPLLRILQSSDRYQVLALNRNEMKLFEGNRDAMDETAPAEGVPRTLTEALGEELTEPRQTVSAVGGRVATLLIEARREIPGRVDAATGELKLDDISHPDTDGVLDDLGAVVLEMGGEVVVVPTERMPTETGIVAIYRY